MGGNKLSVDWKRLVACKECKQELVQYIQTLMELKLEVDENGIDGFDNYLYQCANDFEKVAIDLVCQGCMPDVIKQILGNLLQTTIVTDKLYTKAVLFSEYILMLQEGKHCAQDMRRILMSYLGAECFYC